MWFKKKPKNRRVEKEQSLEVRVRSAKARWAKIRFGVTAGLTALLVAGVAYGLWAGGHWVLHKVIYTNPALAIRRIEIQTDGELPRQLLQKWAGVTAGDNIFALELERARRDLEMAPMIRRATVERALPGTVKIRVWERMPVAQISVYQPGGEMGLERILFHVDSEGCVMRSLVLSSSERVLPSITGIAGTELRPGRVVESQRIQAALRLLTEFKRSSLHGLVELRSIDVSKPQALVVTTGQGSEITFALAGMGHQIHRWEQVHDYGQRVGKVIATLDLSVPNNAPSRWREAGQKNSSFEESSTHRRKHV